MKVLFVITGLFPGGAEKIVLELVRSLLRDGHHAAVVSLLKEPQGKVRTVVDHLEQLGVRPYFLNLSHRSFFRIFRLRKIIRSEAPDIVHSHLMHANLAARLVRLFCRFTLVNTIHIAEKRSSAKIRLLFLLDRLSIHLAKVCTTVSQAAARFHEQRCGLPQNFIRVIYNGSDPVRPATPEKISAFKQQWALSEVTKVIGSIGRLDYQKGYDLFLRSLPSLAPLIPRGERWGILLIGDGPEREKLADMAAEIEREYPALHIVMPGYLPDASAWLPVLDLFVMPSRYEGFGLTLTEALSLGIPSLCSQADSLPELCAFSPENTLSADFTDPKMTEIYRTALSLRKSPGKLFHTTEQMTAEYLALDRKILSEEKMSLEQQV